MERLLVANRGEIALRVFRTAKRMGITTVAIFTDLDADAPHVRAADRAFPVPSYLDVDAVVAAAREAGADAVHPGYGFLSERAPFARALEEAGITLVGPSAAVMEQMGRKDAAREIAVAAGVPVVPTGDDAPYPVLVKAAAGGGGKGMRIVRSEAEMVDAVAAAEREALAAFGDDTMLVEKYVEHGRHIEVQVLGDAYGHVVHLFERDCSTQRRHQKVLEEAPAPTISEDVRRTVLEAAVALATHVGYVNAGTVEFLLDTATDEVYFLEMNTRLQVEHPVTEAVVRLHGEPVDLVERQLRVADGEPLPFDQDDLRLQGHAIEARVYAEDSFGGFLPQAGVADVVRWPLGVRVDQALESGQAVSTAYDPMLGKVVAHGATREEARLALVDALDRTAILGLTTNTGFLRELLAGDDFRDATIDTAWLDRNEVPAPDDAVARSLAGAVLRADLGRAAEGPWQPDGFRLGGEPADLVEDGRRLPAPTGWSAVAPQDDGVDLVGVDDERGFVRRTPGGSEVVWHGQRFVLDRPDPFRGHAALEGGGSVESPMPGTVLAVAVAEGEQVTEGQTLGVVEAMKMELALKAPYDGTVTSVTATAGEQVALGAVLFTVEPA